MKTTVVLLVMWSLNGGGSPNEISDFATVEQCWAAAGWMAEITAKASPKSSLRREGIVYGCFEGVVRITDKK